MKPQMFAAKIQVGGCLELSHPDTELAAQQLLQGSVSGLWLRAAGAWEYCPPAALGGGFWADAPVVYLQADICRQDLLVEIEAAGIHPLAAAA